MRPYPHTSRYVSRTLCPHSGQRFEAALKGTALVPAGQAVTITRTVPHGHVAAAHAMASTLGLPALLGPACPDRDLALALIISRVVAPASKLSTLTWWADTTLGADLGVAGATADDIYAAMDWLEHRQDAIEAKLAARHLAPAANPARMALFDLSSSWLEGRCCPLAARGYSRDGKKGKLQIECGLLTDPAGRPIAVRVFPGNTGDPAAFTQIVEVVRDKFGLAKMVMVGDRGMITSARIGALKPAGGRDGPARVDGEAADLEPPLRFASRRPRCGSGSARATRAPRPQRVSTSRATHPRDGALPGNRRGLPGAPRPPRPARLSPGHPRVTAGSARRGQGAFLKRASAYSRAVAPFS